MPASGETLRKVVNQNGTTLLTRDYVDGIEYLDGVMEAIYHSEGRVKYTNGTARYEYTLRDHLGNGRVYYTDLDGNGIGTPSDILQSESYYAFGLQIDDPREQVGNPVNPYQYNGKELNTDFGLNWHAYGARYYDAAVGRFVSVDSLAEDYASYSPYTYTLNNPIRFIDPDGMRVQSTHLDSEGNEIARFNDGDNGVYRHNNIYPGTHPDGKRTMLGQLRELNGTSGGGVRVGTESVMQQFQDKFENFVNAFSIDRSANNSRFGQNLEKTKGGIQFSLQNGHGGETRYSQNADVGAALDDLIPRLLGTKSAVGNDLKSGVQQIQYGFEGGASLYEAFRSITGDRSELRIPVDSFCNYCNKSPHPGWDYRTIDSKGKIINSMKEFKLDER